MVMANTDFGRPSSSAPMAAPIDVLSQEVEEMELEEAKSQAASQSYQRVRQTPPRAVPAPAFGAQEGGAVSHAARPSPLAPPAPLARPSSGHPRRHQPHRRLAWLRSRRRSRSR